MGKFWPLVLVLLCCGAPVTTQDPCQAAGKALFLWNLWTPLPGEPAVILMARDLSGFGFSEITFTFDRVELDGGELLPFVSSDAGTVQLAPISSGSASYEIGSGQCGGLTYPIGGWLQLGYAMDGGSVAGGSSEADGL